MDSLSPRVTTYDTSRVPGYRPCRGPLMKSMLDVRREEAPHKDSSLIRSTRVPDAKPHDPTGPTT